MVIPRAETSHLKDEHAWQAEKMEAENLKKEKVQLAEEKPQDEKVEKMVYLHVKVMGQENVQKEISLVLGLGLNVFCFYASCEAKSSNEREVVHSNCAEKQELDLEQDWQLGDDSGVGDDGGGACY